MNNVKKVATIGLLLAATSASAQSYRTEDEPVEYRDRKEEREAYRRGYESGYDRGYKRGLEEARRSGQAYAAPPAAAAPPPPPPVILGPIKVTSAFYGSGSKNCDASRWVGRHANGKSTYSFNVSNDMCGDPHHGQRKTLEIVYWCGQVTKSASAREHQSVYLNCSTP
jgi:hypothetical protein